jgi:hypothetical protein
MAVLFSREKGYFLRLPVALISGLDRLARKLEDANPGVRLSRSDVLRRCLHQSLVEHGVLGDRASQ